MTRIGKQPITIPNGVEIKIEDKHVFVKGPKGNLDFDFHRRVNFEIKDKQVLVSVNSPEEKKSRELWGLSRVLVSNMITGVTEGYSKQLEINGVGYKVAVSGKKLTVNAGYSHPVEMEAPEGIDIAVEKNVITVAGIDKQKVGQFSAQIREIRKPEPYKGKGIRYIDEVVRRKAGKVVKAAGA
ncbi:MAG: 50S ribosomal protein L6 [bacterium]|nr:50S ribosomal protein L6 [bacterium]